MGHVWEGAGHVPGLGQRTLQGTGEPRQTRPRTPLLDLCPHSLLPLLSPPTDSCRH